MPKKGSHRQKAFIAPMYVLHVTGRIPRSRNRTTNSCNVAFDGNGATGSTLIIDL